MPTEIMTMMKEGLPAMKAMISYRFYPKLDSEQKTRAYYYGAASGVYCVQSQNENYLGNGEVQEEEIEIDCAHSLPIATDVHSLSASGNRTYRLHIDFGQGSWNAITSFDTRSCRNCAVLTYNYNDIT